MVGGKGKGTITMLIKKKNPCASYTGVGKKRYYYI